MSETPGLPAFDDAVLRAMARWPDVPRCYGWLELDRRGAWRIRGETITHAGAIAFLSRHYRADGDGAWFVQNGPQQAYVTLAYTPWVYRYDHEQGFATHTGLPCTALLAAYLDDEGNVLVETEFGIGLVDDRDLAALAAQLRPPDSDTPTLLAHDGREWPLIAVRRAEVPARFGFVAAPA